MSEDGFVQMLLEVCGGEVNDERDVDLARAAGRWALSGERWRLQLHRSYIYPGNGLDMWITGDVQDQALRLRARLDGGDWRSHAKYPIAHLGHGLDVLAVEGLIPARFSTLGRSALEDHAQVLTRAAARIVNGPDSDIQVDWAMGLMEAADSARRFSGSQLAVLG